MLHVIINFKFYGLLTKKQYSKGRYISRNKEINHQKGIEVTNNRYPTSDLPAFPHFKQFQKFV